MVASKLTFGFENKTLIKEQQPVMHLGLLCLVSTVFSWAAGETCWVMKKFPVFQTCYLSSQYIYSILAYSCIPRSWVYRWYKFCRANLASLPQVEYVGKASLLWFLLSVVFWVPQLYWLLHVFRKTLLYRFFICTAFLLSSGHNSRLWFWPTAWVLRLTLIDCDFPDQFRARLHDTVSRNPSERHSTNSEPLFSL